MIAPDKCTYCNSQVIEQHTCGCVSYKCGNRYIVCGPDPGLSDPAENCVRLQLLAALKKTRLQSGIIRSMQPDKRETYYPHNVRVTDDGPIVKRRDVGDQYMYQEGEWYEVTHVQVVEQVTVKQIEPPTE